MDNHLVIPAAGKSSRFPDMKPKWLLTHPDGELIIQKVISAFDLENYSSTIVTILREHEEKYHVTEIFKQIFSNTVKVCVLEEPTQNAVETIIKTIEENNLCGTITIKDSDGLVVADFPVSKNFICGCNIRDFSVREVHNKSFVVHNVNNSITNIEEKNIVSDVICVGVYSVQIDDLLSAYGKIKDSMSYRYENELYVSHIVSYLLEKGVDFECIYCQQFKDWGTLDAWRSEQEKHKTYFFDIDGVFLYNTGKYGEKNWYNHFDPIEENVDTLRILSRQGHQIIFTTSRDRKAVERFEQYLCQEGINYKEIICDCNHAQRVIVNDFAKTNPFPSCTSISIPRNSNLKDYIK